MSEESDITTITLKKKTKSRLEAIGEFKESYDDLINRILDIFEFKKGDEKLN